MESKKLITATDTQYSGCLLQALNDQRLQGLYCDVTVIVEDRKFRAHKNILSACSTYFHQLFTVAGQVVELNFIRAEIFAEILNYIYSAKIVRVKSDMLEELIKSGKLLGVPFIAELGIPLSQVKSISGGVKDGNADQSKTDDKTQEPIKNTTSAALTKALGVSVLPMLAETFTLSTNSDVESNDDDSDDDVIFCSETFAPPKKGAPEKKEPVTPPITISNEQVPEAKKLTPESGQQQVSQDIKPAAQLPEKPPTPVPKVTTSVAPATANSNAPTPNPPANSNPVPQQNSDTAIASVQPPSDTAASSAAAKPPEKPVTANQNLPKLQPIGLVHPKSELILDSDCISSPPSSSVISVGQPTITHKNISFDGVQKKQVVTVSPGSSSKPGEFKIKIADVVSGSSKDSSEPRRIMDGKKIITLDTASEIEGLSTGCKVYANIGEDTYDIVIPIKDDPEEGLSGLDEDGFPNRKKMKLKHEDHYELIVDGRVYYICIVCKRSYVCLTSLRRHFNVHSWEKKYPCRYCERVFPLAEYRTKHEIHHTGERRYQCLTCGGSFINYQVMASHIRSAHSLDPAGDSKLYRLNPCKSLQIRQYAYVGDNKTNVPVISDGGIVYNIDPDKPQQDSEENHSSNGPKPVNWDDIFLQQSNQSMFKPTTSEGSTEFEFVIPESY
ncbi:PREDICTED: transcriptional regulator Kaiso [Nanorana parkeri]|uniref:transcriptional regulator Kaiso n=1 Tax=Nanorana parkeri TaxID=125878 RepID=UPI000854F47A|nr:PREDICTED: transcriptional regulator Kaiso [Nanorana parkeri]